MNLNKTISRMESTARATKKDIEELRDFLDLLTQSLPYVEEGEEFNKPSARNLSKRIRAAVS